MIKKQLFGPDFSKYSVSVLNLRYFSQFASKNTENASKEANKGKICDDLSIKRPETRLILS